MRIGIIGMGVVGSAVYNGLKNHYEVVGHDKKLESDPFESLLEAEVIFTCLPTPSQMSQHGPPGWGSGQSLQAIHSVLHNLNAKGYRGIVAVKSTVLPGTCQKLQKHYPEMTILSNPEFLTAKTAAKDFVKQTKVLIGGEDLKAVQVLSNVYKKVGVSTAYVVSWTEAETIKYMHNVFLAVKIATFNEFYDVCRERKVNYQLCADLTCEITGWINPRHVQVPGTDGDFGYGGKCFPKDIEAFLCKYTHLDMDVIKGAVASNKKRRRGGSKAEAPSREAFQTMILKPLLKPVTRTACRSGKRSTKV